MSVVYQNQIIEPTEMQHFSIENNTLFVPSSQSTASPMEDPYMFEGEENCLNQEFCYYYYNDQLTPENAFEQTMFPVAYNNELYINDQEANSIVTWSPELELQNHNLYSMNGFPYSYNDIVEYNQFDSYNPFSGQSPIPDEVGGNLLLTQPLSETTQNVIESQQFDQCDCCDLSSFQDTPQQFILENNISSKITEQNYHENYYTPWTDFQLL